MAENKSAESASRGGDADAGAPTKKNKRKEKGEAKGVGKEKRREKGTHVANKETTRLVTSNEEAGRFDEDEQIGSSKVSRKKRRT